MSTSLQKWQAYREADMHECNLLSARINALLTSQSFFIAAVAALYSAQKVEKPLILSLAGVAVVTAVLTGVAITVGCLVLKDWHNQAKKLLEDKKSRKELDGLYLESRIQPDWKHMVSIEVFGIGLAVIFTVFWVVVIVYWWLK